MLDRMYNFWVRTLRFGLMMMGVMMAGRLLLYGLYGGEMGPGADIGDIALGLYRGMQFDGRVVSLCMLVFMAISLSFVFMRNAEWGNKLLLRLGGIVLIVSSLMGMVNAGFYGEFRDQFNHWLFGMYYDDPIAVFGTIWGEYPVIWMSLGSFVFFCSLYWVWSAWMRKEVYRPQRAWVKCMAMLLIVGVMVVGVRGSIGHRPLQRKDVAITGDEFINKTISNGYFSLYFAVKDYKKRMSASGVEDYIADGDVSGALKRLYPERSGGSVDEYLERRAKGRSGNGPDHVFLIVMESQDAWPMLDQYQDLGIMREIRDLADRGVWVKSFVSAGGGTMESLNPLITGLPHAGVFTNYQESSRSPYPTSIAETFRRLGYRTRLFYGGYASWQRLGEFARDQGFDEVYSGSDMGKWEGNEWGVHDKQLFDTILGVVDDEQPSFNFVMTTSNHPRYVVDLESEGCPLCSMPEGLAGQYDGSVSLKVLGHFWYADRCVGDFVREAESKYGRMLVGITADHWSRHFLNGRPTLYEYKAVPFVMYGPEVLDGVFVPKEMAGSHLDILPTLVELSAPEGFVYYAMGHDMLDPFAEQIGMGVGAVVTPGAIWDTSNNRPAQAIPPGEGMLSVNGEALTQRYNDFHGVGWWRIMRGELY